MVSTLSGIRAGVETRRGRFFCAIPYDIKDAFKNLSGYLWHKKEKLWSWPASPRTARGIDHRFRLNRCEYHADDPFRLILIYTKTDFCTEFLDPGIALPPIPKTKTEPWDHQVRAFWFAVERLGGLHEWAHGGVLLGMSMGSGKSKVLLDLIASYNWWRTLVICPAKVVPVWPYQAELHAAIPMRVVTLPTKQSTAKRAEHLRRSLQFQNTPTVVVTNYEALDYKVMRDAIRDQRWNAVALDEGHRIKDPGGKRSRWLSKFADEVPCRLELTGTVMPNNPMDLYAQARWLDASYFGYRFAEFRANYAILGPLPDGNLVRILGYKNEEDLAQELKQFCIEVRSEDFQKDLPDRVHVKIPVELDASRKAYDAMHDDFVVWLGEEGEVTAANILVKIGKLQELSGGFLRDPETKKVHRFGREKIEAVAEVIADLPAKEPLVIGARMKPDLAILRTMCGELGRTVYEVSGARNELEEWQRASGGEVLIAQIQSAKEGIDLTRSRYCFFYSLTYQPGEFDQFSARQARPGQKADTVTYYHFAAKDTVDERIYESIREKKTIINSIREMAREVM